MYLCMHFTSEAHYYVIKFEMTLTFVLINMIQGSSYGNHCPLIYLYQCFKPISGLKSVKGQPTSFRQHVCHVANQPLHVKGKILSPVCFTRCESRVLYSMCLFDCGQKCLFLICLLSWCPLSPELEDWAPIKICWCTVCVCA